MYVCMHISCLKIPFGIEECLHFFCKSFFSCLSYLHTQVIVLLFIFLRVHIIINKIISIKKSLELRFNFIFCFLDFWKKKNLKSHTSVSSECYERGNFWFVSFDFLMFWRWGAINGWIFKYFILKSFCLILI